jgi:hypothetical protein
MVRSSWVLDKYKWGKRSQTPMAVRRSNRWNNQGRQTEYGWNAVKHSLRSVKEWSGIYGCTSPAERRVETVWRWGMSSLKNKAAYYWLPYFLWDAKCLWNGGKPNRYRASKVTYKSKTYLWKCKVDRLEQPNGTKGTTAERPLYCPCYLERYGFGGLGEDFDPIGGVVCSWVFFHFYYFTCQIP